MTTPKIILVPTDFSKSADHALDYAIELAATLGARITVMHAYEIAPVDFLDGALLDHADTPGKILAAAQAALQATVAKRTNQGVELTPLLKAGEPRESIQAGAEEISADLIVMGRHGRRWLSRVLLGSVAEYVVRTATRPVLTVHAAAKS